MCLEEDLNLTHNTSRGIDPVEEYRKLGIETGDADKATDEAVKSIGGEVLSVSTLSTEIPRKLKNRPRIGNMVVPYLATRGKNGEYLFAIVDERKRIKVARDNLCGVCGKGLPWKFYFIGGPRSLDSKMFVDPPMHAECAIYSLAVCPYLRHKAGTHRSTIPEDQELRLERDRKKVKNEMDLETFELVQEGRPQLMGLYLTSSYRFEFISKSRVDKVQYYFVAGRALEVWWFEGVE